ncbi:hypothetical protein EXN22_16145 [Pseudomonas tructae]|uniref:Uncharacterized protein n=1 Tax=Pseudomonas tructae TaxID=2518644 RepID=A0A411MK55_9PSED|nr:hypothetical protein [Pseudomonas tructae]QBF27147.1 hypothetical protein EXN22_16145 [Pseudomonas tructae]
MISPANTPDLSQASVLQMIQDAMASGAPMVTINQAVTEGQVVTLPSTNNDITLNLETGGAQLNAVTVNLPANSDGRVGQRVFVNSDGQIVLAHFQSSIAVNGGDYMFNPGDNCVFYRNKPAILSRITA